MVGAAWAEMLGARFVRFGDAPVALYPDVPVYGSALEDIRPALSLAGVSRIYLGFPIWNVGPAAPA